jgi:hypothetical protein
VMYSLDLDMHYTVRVDPKHGSEEYPEHGCGSTILVFEDGVEYSLAEALHISRDELQTDDIKALHAVKKLFDGQLLPGSEMVTAWDGLRPGQSPATSRYARRATR